MSNCSTLTGNDEHTLHNWTSFFRIRSMPFKNILKKYPVFKGIWGWKNANIVLYLAGTTHYVRTFSGKYRLVVCTPCLIGQIITVGNFVMETCYSQPKPYRTHDNLYALRPKLFRLTNLSPRFLDSKKQTQQAKESWNWKRHWERVRARLCKQKNEELSNSAFSLNN